MRTCIVAHAPCLDGYAASRLLFRTLSTEHTTIVDWNLRPDTLDKEVLKASQVIYFVDCCPSPALVDELAENAQQIVIVDHHETNEKAINASRVALRGNVVRHFNNTLCATELVCDYFVSTEQPWYVQHIGDGDLWRWKHKDSKAIVRALSVPLDLERLDQMNEDERRELVLRGEALLATDEAVVTTLAATREFIDVFFENEWHRAAWLRLSRGFSDYRLLSDLGSRVANNVAIALLIDEHDKVSTRHNAMDNSVKPLHCGNFCKQFGGGGHAAAAGCTIKGAYEHGLVGEHFRRNT